MKKLYIHLDQGERLDKVVFKNAQLASRAMAQRLIKLGRIKVDGLVKDQCDAVVCGDITLEVDEGVLPEPFKLKPEEIPLDVIFEDRDLLVINKQAGLVVHPGAGNREGTLAAGLLNHCVGSPDEGLSDINGEERPGIVHRLDKDTSGIMVIAKNNTSHVKLSGQFASRSIIKKYLAFCHKVPNPIDGMIETCISRDSRNRQKMAVKRSGRTAKTGYRVLRNFANVASKMECTLFTGRTHQIRVHMEYLKTPIIGDPLYNLYSIGKYDFLTNFARQALHAYYIKFDHPASGIPMEFTAPLPTDLEQLEEFLETIQNR